MANENGITTSRLFVNTQNLRNSLYSRNLYTPNGQYPLSNDSVINKTVGVINSIIGGIAPFKSYNLENTAIGKIITIDNQSPLSLIGLAMLGKQMALNSMSSIAQENFPVINPSNLFDKNSTTKLFTKQIDYSITAKSGNTKFNNFLSSVIYWYPQHDNPFAHKNISSSEYIKNTGQGQLKQMYSLISMNLYKPSNSNTDTTFYDYAKIVGNPLTSISGTSMINKKYFTFDDRTFYPNTTLGKNKWNKNFVNLANTSMINSFKSFNSAFIEYDSEIAFIDALGSTKKKVPKYTTESEFSLDSSTNANTIVWGRDGANDNVIANLKYSRGSFGDTQNIIADNNGITFSNNYNVKGGILEYTRNLVTATGGKIGDLTRKLFDNSLNGSALFEANNSTYANRAGIAKETGVRQHSALDQYDRFAKAIRFNGNNVYNGNPDSVIYNTVLPRIHPYLNKEGNMMNKNLMLSIENLAVKVISKDGVGIIDDEYGSEIPACEVGPFNGRIMWFPPYGLELNETAIAKYESTVMVGRSEPIYNYQNSERTATLSFMLLIDYPPHVRNYANSTNAQKDIADFFAFGGDNMKNTPNTTDLEHKISELEIKKKDFEEQSGKWIQPKLSQPPAKYIYFPNDIPRISGEFGNLDTIIDTMYQKMYEIDQQVISTPDFDGTKGSNNKPIYYVDGLKSVIVDGMVKYEIDPSVSVSQYTSVGLVNPYDGSSSELNQMLKDAFQDQDIAPYYKIKITGAASQLFKTKYNYELGMRRARAAQILVQKRLLAMFGNKVNPEYEILSLGESTASDIGEDKKEINSQTVKLDRYAKIEIVRNSKSLEKSYVLLDPAKKQLLDETNLQIANLKAQLNALKKGINASNLENNCVMNERLESDSAILHGFSSIKGNYFYPVFHSQTPEDFHKRLTFLQQCTRQGSAKRYSVEADSNGVLRARNSVFGRQPICILRIGDFFYTKVIIESINVDYVDTTWDMNPEGFGMQPMIAKVQMQMKVIGGQSLKGPIDALQNAVSYNFYANSSYTSEGRYLLPAAMAAIQSSYQNGINTSDIDNQIIEKFISRNKQFAERILIEQQNDTAKETQAG